ncbi:hypothetical protein PIROE2DRAFT_25786, partial [Piromyces sp. E2]
SPLYLACQFGFEDIVKLLVESGANINSINDDWTPIEIACSNGFISIVDYLLEKGANVHLKTPREYKLLHIATEENNLEMVKLLIEKGNMNVNSSDSGGWTALHIASHENYYEIAKYLIKQKNADVN